MEINIKNSTNPTCKFQSLIPGDTFIYEGNVCMKVKNSKQLNAINLSSGSLFYLKQTQIVDEVQSVRLEVEV